MSFIRWAIPRSRAEARGWRLVTWALFGNDDDGIFGEDPDNVNIPGFGPNAPQTFGQFCRWWLRNPFHNLFFHVLAWAPAEAFVLVECPPLRAFRRRPHRNWVTTGAQFQLVARPLFVSWRIAGWEGYLGWRERGALGAAFRRF